MARAAEIRVFALQSPQIVISQLAAHFEERSGHRITQLLAVTELDVDAKRRIDAGESFDAAFIPPLLLAELANQGKIIDATRTDFLRVGIGVAMRAGAPKRDISSVEAFKRALLDAKSIAYLKGGISGPYLSGLVERLGIAAQLQPKTLRPEKDVVGELVARGEAELGVTAISTLLATDGIDVIGPLPPQIQSYVTFAGGVSASAIEPEAARDLMEFLTGPAATAIVKAKGMEPG